MAGYMWGLISRQPRLIPQAISDSFDENRGPDFWAAWVANGDDGIDSSVPFGSGGIGNVIARFEGSRSTGPDEVWAPVF